MLGTVQLGLNYGINNQQGKPSRDEAFQILSYAGKQGIKTLDTAQAYGDAIDVIGAFHKTNDPFDVVTKITHSEDLNVSEYVQQLIKKLNVQKLQAVLLHKFSDLTEHKELLHSLLELKEKGWINKIGVSVYTNEELILSCYKKEIDLIQLPFNLLDNYSLRSAGIKEAVKNNKILHVRSVFLQGLFFMPLQSLPSLLEPLKPYLNMLREISHEQNISLNALALKYVLQTAEIDGVLIGVDSASQLKSNLSFVDDIPLSQSMITRINSIQCASPHLLNPVNWK